MHLLSTPRNSSLASYFASKILAFKTPLPLGISMTLHKVGMDFFLELHIWTKKKALRNGKENFLCNFSNSEK